MSKRGRQVDSSDFSFIDEKISLRMNNALLVFTAEAMLDAEREMERQEREENACHQCGEYTKYNWALAYCRRCTQFIDAPERKCLLCVGDIRVLGRKETHPNCLQLGFNQ